MFLQLTDTFIEALRDVQHRLASTESPGTRAPACAHLRQWCARPPRWCNSLRNPRDTLIRACDCIPASSGAADEWRWSLGARLMDSRETRLKSVPERVPTDQCEERVEAELLKNWILLVNGLVSWIRVFWRNISVWRVWVGLRTFERTGARSYRTVRSVRDSRRIISTHQTLMTQIKVSSENDRSNFFIHLITVHQWINHYRRRRGARAHTRAHARLNISV